MDEGVVKFRVGVMVLATVIIAAILVVLFSEKQSLLRPTYTLYIHFQEAPAVTRDTPIRKSGILIGRVADVQFADKNPQFGKNRGVIVTASINSDIELRHGEICRIKATLLGDAILEFVPGDKESDAVYAHGDLLTGRVAGNPLEALQNLEGNIGEAVTNVSAAGAQIGRLAQHLDELLVDNDDQLSRIVGKTERALDSIQRAIDRADKVFGDEQVQEDLRSVLKELPAMMRDSRDTVAGIQSSIELANKNLKNLEGLTGPLGEKGNELASNLDSGLERLDELLGHLNEFGRAINGRDGSLGQLVHSRELYDNLNSTVRNVEHLTRELKPIVRDARAFSDKIARHPELLGVRGALKGSSGAKGLRFGTPAMRGTPDAIFDE